MKTIAFGGNRNLARALFVLAALGGIYYFRRRGKSVSDLVAAGSSGLKQARSFSSRLINRVAPPMAQNQSVASNAQI